MSLYGKEIKKNSIFATNISIIYMDKTTTELILIRISGLDRPGLTASITEILSGYDVDIMDIGQADIHSTLSLGILFKCCEKDSGNIMKDLLFKASELGINIRFYPISREEYEEWVSMQGKNRYILTLLGRKLTAQQIAGATKILANQGLNIDAIRRLTGRVPLDERKAKVRACIEFSVRGTPRDIDELQSELMRLSTTLDMDFSFQKDTMYRRMRRLICFDMDSTLIKTEVIDELAKRAGVGEQVQEITARAMRGEIDFRESFKERVALLKGLDESVMKDIAEHLPITEGVERLMYVLKRYGYKIAILSGGFTYFGNYLKERFGIDYVYANNLEIVDGKLTGRYVGDIVDGKRKAELLQLLAQVENVDIAQTIAVGDGANDLPMLSAAGLGIAFHAKPKVKANAKQSINTIGLDGVLYFLGFKDSYLDERGNS
jgi:phosphoserine phosphatase